ncbi:MAG: ribosome biogenesis GTPase YlqF [Erysipelotrichaceae bacterium]|nr:ribosome biogenesis GTPase YlqF [Erysipelotrichaceae bacterium]
MSEKNTNINWFPGHMAKARREMSEKIKMVDLVIELRDARIPFSSLNPLLDEVIGEKPRILVMAKADKADETVTEAWKRHFQDKGYYVLALDLLHQNAADIISKACQNVMREKIEKLKARGMRHVEIKAMVVGVPNVGKSTLINNVSRRRKAQTADHPGVTRNLQWIKVSPDVALLDTPGVLWPKFDSQDVAMKLAICGSISDSVLPFEEMVRYALDYLIVHYPRLLKERYETEVVSDADEMLKAMAVSRHFMDSEGKPDLYRMRNVFMNELRDGLVGRISWEQVNENT